MTDRLIKELTGTTESHITTSALPEGVAKPVHSGVVAPFLALQADAAKEGFDLQIASGFRSYKRQLLIWNGKAEGSREVSDEQGQPMIIDALTDEQLLLAMMRWSAVPGTSRHHWGTEMDVYDAAAIDSDYQVQLSPEEVSDQGIFGPMHQWLDKKIVEGGAHGFFRPYADDRQGVAPERWHLSYAPLSGRYQEVATVEVLAEFLSKQEFALKETLMAEWEKYFRRFIDVPTECYPEAYAEMPSN